MQTSTYQDINDMILTSNKWLLSDIAQISKPEIRIISE